MQHRVVPITSKSQHNIKLSVCSLVFYLCFFKIASISTSFADLIALPQAAETTTLIQNYPK